METVILHFWNRWRSEYLTSLRGYQKLQNTRKLSRILELYHIVIINDDMLPRHQWRLGRIIELIKGRDSEIRAIKLLVGKSRSVIDRPINLVYPIGYGINSTDESSEMNSSVSKCTGESKRDEQLCIKSSQTKCWLQLWANLNGNWVVNYKVALLQLWQGVLNNSNETLCLINK